MPETTDKADFHVHYTEDSAQNILVQAQKSHLVAVGLIGRAEISDHIDEYVSLGKEMGIQVFSGVECLSRVKDGEFVDLIAIGVDHQHPDMRKYFGKKDGRALNATIAEKQFKFLASQGFSFDDLSFENEKLLQELRSGEFSEKAIRFCQIVAGSTQNQELVVSLQEQFPDEWTTISRHYGDKPGYVGRPDWVSAKFLYTLFFTPGKPGYVPIQPLSVDFIQAAHAAGGVILYSPEGKFQMDTWETLQAQGIDGLMAWHAGQMEVSSRFANRLHKEGYLVLGGSDYHPDKNHWQLGNGKGDMYISPRRLSDLETRLKKVRNLV